MKRAGITLRYGAGVRSVDADGHHFDRNEMDKKEDDKLRRLVVEASRKATE